MDCWHATIRYMGAGQSRSSILVLLSGLLPLGGAGMIIAGSFLPWLSVLVGPETSPGATDHITGWHMVRYPKEFFRLNPISDPRAFLFGGIIILVVAILVLIRRNRVGTTGMLALAALLSGAAAYTAGTLVGQAGFLQLAISGEPNRLTLGGLDFGMWLIIVGGGIAFLCAAAQLLMTLRSSPPVSQADEVSTI